jgi:hypothetical protein
MEVLVTNNPLVQAQCRSGFKVEFLDTDLLGVLIHVRDRVHKGYRLLTHPLSGSVKPNESPYKSVLIFRVAGTQPETDIQSVNIIEECILTAKKFTPKHIPDQYFHDLQVADFSLISSR